VVSLGSENINIKPERTITLIVVTIMEPKHLSNPSTGMESIMNPTFGSEHTICCVIQGDILSCHSGTVEDSGLLRYRALSSG
jgi:hypothetical protein